MLSMTTKYLHSNARLVFACITRYHSLVKLMHKTIHRANIHWVFSVFRYCSQYLHTYLTLKQSSAVGTPISAFDRWTNGSISQQKWLAQDHAACVMKLKINPNPDAATWLPGPRSEPIYSLLNVKRKLATAGNLITSQVDRIFTLKMVPPWLTSRAIHHLEGSSLPSGYCSLLLSWPLPLST